MNVPPRCQDPRSRTTVIIDRYAAGAFTAEELTVSAEIRTDYRQSFAWEIVNTILSRR